MLKLLSMIVLVVLSLAGCKSGKQLHLGSNPYLDPQTAAIKNPSPDDEQTWWNLLFSAPEPPKVSLNFDRLDMDQSRSSPIRSAR